jgi:hypothetical protein
MTLPRSFALVFALGSLAASVVACGRDESPTSSGAAKSAGTGGAAASGTTSPSSTTVGASKYSLAADPAGGLSVLDAKKAAPKQEVVVVGRVRTLTSGFAAFTLIDVSLPYCGEAADGCEGCPEPWDYCCHTTKEIAAGSLPVAVKVKGEVVELEKIPELRNLDLVAVTGTLTKEKDDVILEATGWYRRARPDLPASIKFPQ